LTIERIRTLVLVAVVLLLAALGLFLAKAKWKNLLVRKDLPQRLGLNIQQEANGYTFVHAFGAHSQYKIHASKEIQLKNDHVELHDVQIELYGADGSRVDRIAGDKFEFDQKTGIATAQGPVEMQLTRPVATPKEGENIDLSKMVANKEDPRRQVQVKTSGLVFDRNSGVVTTGQRVNFSMAQGAGSAMGAKYDAQSGHLVLEQAVELTVRRGNEPVSIRAQHAEFDRDSQICWLRTAVASYRGGEANAGQTKILFREEGSAERLEMSGGLVLTTATGSRLAAPVGAMDFDEHNQPHHGHLAGGVTMDSARDGRTSHGTASTAELEFTSRGLLRHARLEHGVTLTSEENGPQRHVSRSWRSPVADLDFRGGAEKGQVEPEKVYGTGGVVVTSEIRRKGAQPEPSRMSADEITGWFGPNSVMRSMSGAGHAGIEQSTADGAHQTGSGDRIEARFAPASGASKTKSATKKSGNSSADQVEWAELDGRVVLFEQPAAGKPVGKVAKSTGKAAKFGAQPQAPMRATAGKAVYEGGGEWLHLTVNPRVVNGGLELTAEKIDLSRQSGDAFAHNNVKATWSETNTGGKPGGNSGESSMNFGGKGPAHVIANEAQLSHAAGEATFHGHARLWQQTNSVSGPTIVLNQEEQTLVARSSDAAEPVRTVLLNASQMSANKKSGAKPTSPSVIRAHGGDLWYSDSENRLVIHGGGLGPVIAETGAVTSSSNAVELHMLPAGSRGNTDNQSQVDRMTATGHVLLTAQHRRGSGEQLVYSNATGDYVLTGSAAVPPKMSDPEQGNVTGAALIFHSRNDSVSIEGGGRGTQTVTAVPEARRK